MNEISVWNKNNIFDLIFDFLKREIIGKRERELVVLFVFCFKFYWLKFFNIILKRNNMSTIFSQQILSSRLLLIVIVGAKM